MTLLDSAGTPWPAERAHAYVAERGPVRGCNYLPRTAINMIDMFQADTFDRTTIAEELGWAEALGLNSVRVFVPYLVWDAEPAAMLARFDEFLGLAAARGMHVTPVMFDDCAWGGRDAVLGPQPAPVAGVHNSGWVASPGPARVVDRAAWPRLREFVHAFLGAFGRDRRVYMWDLYNEPGNAGMGTRTIPLALATFAWAREAAPDQPLTTSPYVFWEGAPSRMGYAVSDVVTFHSYEGPKVTEGIISVCEEYGRPVVCTEWMSRTLGSTYAAMLPVFARHGVGWYQWGLVNGRTQTHYTWGGRPGDPEPDLWHHDTLREDGTPYDAAEAALLRAHAGLGTADREPAAV